MKTTYKRRITMIVAKLEELIEEMEDERDAIEAVADEREREMTSREEDEYETLDQCASDCQNAIDYLSEYTIE